MFFEEVWLAQIRTVKERQTGPGVAPNKTRVGFGMGSASNFINCLGLKLVLGMWVSGNGICQ